MTVPFIGVPDNSSARVRLFCLPYAGAGTAPFHAWPSVLPRDIQVCPIRLPGREGRLKETPYTSVTLLVDDLAPELLPHLDKPFALFGHSMGAIIAFELARELRRRFARVPLRLFASACRAPHRPLTDAALSGLPRDLLLAEVQRQYGEIDRAVLASPALLDLVVPALRADLTMIEAYRYVEETPLDCPISVLGGSHDATVCEADLLAWSRHTGVGFDRCLLPGGHHFLASARDALLDVVERGLRFETHLHERSDERLQIRAPQASVAVDDRSADAGTDHDRRRVVRE